MGAMKDWDHRLREGEFVSDLQGIAELLGGEVDGRAIRCASPGRSDGDRSCHIRIDPERPNSFFIYDCAGSKASAYAAVRRKLQLATPPTADHSAAAQRIWKETVPAPGTLVEGYLRSRAITLVLPPCLRFHPGLHHAGTRSAWPAMVAARANADGGIVAVHRTFLSGRGKAPVEPVRMDLGAARGTAIRLAPVADELMIGEGIETTLSVIQVTGRPAWAAGSAIAMRTLVLPKAVCSVLILADGDDPGEAAARAAAARWKGEGRQVRIARAPEGKDFNDLLIQEAAT